MEFWTTYGLFFAKTITLVIAILLLVIAILAISRRGKSPSTRLEVKKINEKFNDYENILVSETLTKAELKKRHKEKKAKDKAESKAAKKNKEHKKRIFVLDFQGDIKASPLSELREEVSAILQVATPEDKIVVCLESPGGMVANYGLAASQLRRFREKNIPLTVIVDKVAASGGYMMACVANQILAAPFAIVGSIGVVAQLPNFHRFLKKREIDFEQLTAGQYKRTLTLFGENTEKAREKMQAEIEEVHVLFKDFILQNRPQVDMAQVATGEHWLGTRALDLKLIDGITTSDQYLLEASKDADIYHVCYTTKKSFSEKISSMFSSLLYRGIHGL